MKFTEAEFIPVLFGNDINVYSVARAFYEQYGVQSIGFGKAAKGTCYLSRLIDFTAVPGLDEAKTFVKTVNDFAEKHREKAILAIGCGDNYVKCLAQNQGEFSANVIAPYADYDFLEGLMDKEKFYALCEKHGIDYPKTVICTKENRNDLELPFSAPYIIKPANQVMYYRHKFEGQKKVFCAESEQELRTILRKTYEAGYTDHMIIQDFLPGDDTYMRVLTGYADRNAKVKMMCLGHVLLEEHTPYGIGNHAVIITEYEEELMMKFKKLLEEIHYVGFFNFDIKLDERDGKYKVFEINTRQGRSNFYVTGSGHNIARCYVEDYVYHRELSEDFAKNEYLWMVVPRGVAFRYAPAYKDRMKRLIREKKYVNPLFFKEDRAPGRMFRLYKSQLGHYYKFHKYLKKPEKQE